MERLDWLRQQVETAYRGPSWHGPSLREALEGVDDERARERPLAAAHTIAELVEHAAAWKRIVTGWARGGRRGPVADAVDWPSPQPWLAALDGLERAHAELVQAIEALEPATLARSLGEWTLAQALSGAAHHDLYHAGQVALLRRVGAAPGS